MNFNIPIFKHYETICTFYLSMFYRKIVCEPENGQVKAKTCRSIKQGVS